MIIFLLYGSVSNDRKAIKASKYVRGLLEERGHQVHFIDPIENTPPLLDKMYKESKRQGSGSNGKNCISASGRIHNR